MQVYEGLDIGTAKPSPEERQEIHYYGIDIVPPTEDFSVSSFCSYVEEMLGEIGGDIIVCGGTGLYAKVLTEGLAEGPAPDPAERLRWESAVTGGHLDLLKQELREADQSAFAALKDTENPRRLVRALEWAKAGASKERSWGRSESVLTGVVLEPAELRTRIDARAERMFGKGLIEETRSVVERFGKLSRTAAQAIGYSEALAVIEGRMKIDEALETVKSRTRRLAKKQRTWFRHQARVDWIEAGSDDLDVIADRIEESWKRNGAITVRVRGE